MAATPAPPIIHSDNILLPTSRDELPASGVYSASRLAGRISKKDLVDMLADQHRVVEPVVELHPPLQLPRHELTGGLEVEPLVPGDILDQDLETLGKLLGGNHRCPCRNLRAVHREVLVREQTAHLL